MLNILYKMSALGSFVVKICKTKNIYYFIWGHKNAIYWALPSYLFFVCLQQMKFNGKHTRIYWITSQKSMFSVYRFHSSPVSQYATTFIFRAVNNGNNVSKRQNFRNLVFDWKFILQTSASDLISIFKYKKFYCLLFWSLNNFCLPCKLDIFVI